jgi:hypothetical protein
MLTVQAAHTSNGREQSPSKAMKVALTCGNAFKDEPAGPGGDEPGVAGYGAPLGSRRKSDVG